MYFLHVSIFSCNCCKSKKEGKDQESIQSSTVDNPQKYHMSRDMRFPAMWYVRPAKAQTSLRVRAV